MDHIDLTKDELQELTMTSLKGMHILQVVMVPSTQGLSSGPWAHLGTSEFATCKSPVGSGANLFCEMVPIGQGHPRKMSSWQNSQLEGQHLPGEGDCNVTCHPLCPFNLPNFCPSFFMLCLTLSLPCGVSGICPYDITLILPPWYNLCFSC